MKYTLHTLLLMVCFVVIPGQAASQIGGPGDAMETTLSGRINWTIGEVFATGTGAPPSQAVNAAQARAMAERAAVVVAYRNLLETVKGVRVDSQTVVENFMTKSDVIKTKVDGIVKGARIVKTQYLSDGSVEVLVAMPLRGALLDAVIPEYFGRLAEQFPMKPSPAPSRPADARPAPQPQKPAEPQKPSTPLPPAVDKKTEPVTPLPSVRTQENKPEPAKQDTATTAFRGGVATGLVIDGRGLGLRPALLPKIFDSLGQELYVGQVVTRTNAVEQGVAGYARDVSAASNNFRVTDNPAVIKGVRASGSARTDIVVGQADAQTLRQLSSNAAFLQYCRVIIVY